MPINAQNRTLPDWFTRIRTRQLVLPRFQRFEAWGHDYIAPLFNTVLQGLPVGAMLVLEIGNEEPFLSRSLVGAPSEGERITEHLLDGQQRMTALWRGLHNNYEDRTYFLHLEPDEETGLPYYVESIHRWQREDDKEYRPFWANDPAKVWQRRMVPLHLCAPGDIAWDQFREWSKQAIENADERDTVADQVRRVRDAFLTFNLPFLALPANTKKDVALNVFIRMNTTTVPLSTFDIVVAQVEAGMGVSMHELVAEIRRSAPTIAHYYPPEDLVLAAGALLQDQVPTNGSYLAKDFGTRLYANRDALIGGIRRAAIFLEEEKIFDAKRLPTETIMAPLAALWSHAPKGGDGEGRARTILRRYLWRSFFTGRYERATTTRTQADYLQLKKLIAGDAAAKPPIFDGGEYPLPEPQELLKAAWPKKKDRIARGLLAVALRKGGLDLADGSVVSLKNLEQREYHHLFPVAHLARLGIAEDEAYVALNCALVTWRTNRTISDQEPEEYLAKRLDGANVTEHEVRSRLTSHLIPYDEMVTGDYQAFLEKRAELLYADIKELCKPD